MNSEKKKPTIDRIQAAIAHLEIARDDPRSPCHAEHVKAALRELEAIEPTCLQDGGQTNTEPQAEQESRDDEICPFCGRDATDKGGLIECDKCGARFCDACDVGTESDTKSCPFCAISKHLAFGDARPENQKTRSRQEAWDAEEDFPLHAPLVPDEDEIAAAIHNDPLQAIPVTYQNRRLPRHKGIMFVDSVQTIGVQHKRVSMLKAECRPLHKARAAIATLEAKVAAIGFAMNKWIRIGSRQYHPALLGEALALCKTPAPVFYTSARGLLFIRDGTAWIHVAPRVEASDE